MSISNFFYKKINIPTINVNTIGHNSSLVDNNCSLISSLLMLSGIDFHTDETNSTEDRPKKDPLDEYKEKVKPYERQPSGFVGLENQ